MRKILFATAATAVLLSAGAAFAGDDSTNIQLNKLTAQISLNNINDVYVGGALEATSGAIGNTVSVKTEVNAPGLDNTSIVSSQINREALQLSVTNLDDLTVGGSAEAGAQAVGNAGSFYSANGDISVKPWQDASVAYGGDLSSDAALAMNTYDEAFAYQRNADALQVAVLNSADVRVGGEFDGSATAVANSLVFDAPNGNTSAVAFQENTNSLQFALNNFQNGNVAGNAVFSGQAIGNISSWSSANYGASDGINFQGNLNTAQVGISNISNSHFGAGLTVGTIAAGNVANVR